MPFLLCWFPGSFVSVRLPGSPLSTGSILFSGPALSYGSTWLTCSAPSTRSVWVSGTTCFLSFDPSAPPWLVAPLTLLWSVNLSTTNPALVSRHLGCTTDFWVSGFASALHPFGSLGSSSLSPPVLLWTLSPGNPGPPFHPSVNYTSPFHHFIAISVYKMGGCWEGGGNVTFKLCFSFSSMDLYFVSPSFPEFSPCFLGSHVSACFYSY